MHLACLVTLDLEPLPEFPDPLGIALGQFFTAFDTGAELATEDVLKWRADPYRWARKRLGLRLHRWQFFGYERYQSHVWDGTKEPLYAAAQALAEWKSAAISSGTGSGKTYLGAVLVYWFLDCFSPAQVITAAPGERQLTLNLWKELHALWPLFKKIRPQAEIGALSIMMRPGEKKWGAEGFICGVGKVEEVAGRARGFHNEHMLLIFEETNAINPAILQAFKLTCTAPHNLRLYFGNPDSDQDQLAVMSRGAGVVAVRASSLDHPNIVLNNPDLVPGAVSAKAIADWTEDMGGEESPLWQSRVRGIAPAEGKYALVKRAWLEAAAARWRASNDDPALRERLERGDGAAGVDCAASDTGDKASICVGKGLRVRSITKYPCPDGNEFARLHVAPLIDSGEVTSARRVGIDPIGVGHGPQMELKRLGHLVSPLNGGAKVWERYLGDEKFMNLRTQMWWQARKDLMSQDPDQQLALPPDEDLFADLTAPMWWPKGGKVIVESKDDFKKRLGRSPDKGDAFVYWNWIRTRDGFADFDTEASRSGVSVSF